ncbi:hypothetical protein JT358_15635 [Micrococcales bacterium 31B]|nr:hypothetical protein [Micrococcales bacterium 31B]
MWNQPAHGRAALLGAATALALALSGCTSLPGPGDSQSTAQGGDATGAPATSEATTEAGPSGATTEASPSTDASATTDASASDATDPDTGASPLTTGAESPAATADLPAGVLVNGKIDLFAANQKVMAAVQNFRCTSFSSGRSNVTLYVDQYAVAAPQSAIVMWQYTAEDGPEEDTGIDFGNDMYFKFENHWTKIEREFNSAHLWVNYLTVSTDLQDTTWTATQRDGTIFYQAQGTTLPVEGSTAKPVDYTLTLSLDDDLRIATMDYQYASSYALVRCGHYNSSLPLAVPTGDQLN